MHVEVPDLVATSPADAECDATGAADAISDDSPAPSTPTGCFVNQSVDQVWQAIAWSLEFGWILDNMSKLPSEKQTPLKRASKTDSKTISWQPKTVPSSRLQAIDR
jgi:hypothetical protein